jgi:hypothetical protein
MSAGATTPGNPQARRHWSLVLPHAPLPEALAICLDMVGSKRYERAAISWHTRFCAYAPELTFSDAQALMTALAALPGSEQAAGAAQLAALSRRYWLDDVADTLERWMAARPIPLATRPRPGASHAARRFTPRGHHPTAA